MYQYIYCPVRNQNFYLNSSYGKNILKNYFKMLIQSSKGGKNNSAPLDANSDVVSPHMSRMKKELQEATDDLNLATSTLKTRKEQQKKFKSTLKRKEEELSKVTKDIESGNTTEENVQATLNKQRKLQNEVSACEIKLSDTNQRIGALNTTIEQLQNKLNEQHQQNKTQNKISQPVDKTDKKF